MHLPVAQKPVDRRLTRQHKNSLSGARRRRPHTRRRRPLETAVFCSSVSSSVRTKTRITFEPFTRLTSRFFLHACKFTFYHMNLKSHIRIKEILNLHAIALLLIYDLFDPFMPSSTKLVCLTKTSYEPNNVHIVYHTRLSYRMPCILLTHFRSRAYFDPLRVFAHFKVFSLRQPYFSLSCFFKTFI